MQHLLFTDLPAELAALQEAAAAIEQQLHNAADVNFYACTHIWTLSLHPLAYSAEASCQVQTPGEADLDQSCQIVNASLASTISDVGCCRNWGRDQHL
eukprot:3725452-Rhodomonas_salina.2